MKSIYEDILQSAANGEKLLVVLIDPDKMDLSKTADFIRMVNASNIAYIFVGGSEVAAVKTDQLVEEIKKYTILPVIIFPGDITQITGHADALLFLSLISGRNPDYLIGKQVEAVSELRKTQLEIIPTGYILIENGKETAVQMVTGTVPIPRSEIQIIADTAKAGELLGMKLVYLESGSGAEHPIPGEIIRKVKNELNIPLIVGGGIRSVHQLESAYQSGADLVVIGTAFESDNSFFEQLKEAYF